MVPCGVSFPLFFPLVERKEAVGDRTRSQYGGECVSVSAGDNPAVIAFGADCSLYTREPKIRINHHTSAQTMRGGVF